MTKEYRGLLVPGNSKLGEAIFHFDLPAVATCPGRSAVCEKVCYARDGRFRYAPVRRRLAWCLVQSRRRNFVENLSAEIAVRGVQVLRLHVAGDFYGAGYARKWLAVMRQRSRVRYFCYTRSWRVPAIAPVLEEMALLPQCRVWYSTDADTGAPARVPPGVRLAYLQTDLQEEPSAMDLRFVVHKLRPAARRLALPLLCPHEARRAESCGACGKCFH
jgi:hypothetical protein